MALFSGCYPVFFGLEYYNPQTCSNPMPDLGNGSKLTIFLKSLIIKNGCNNEKETTVSA